MCSQEERFLKRNRLCKAKVRRMLIHADMGQKAQAGVSITHHSARIRRVVWAPIKEDIREM